MASTVGRRRHSGLILRLRLSAIPIMLGASDSSKIISRFAPDPGLRFFELAGELQ